MRKLAMVLGMALACSIPSMAGAATTQVGVKDYAFAPKAVKVAVGDSVHWSRDVGSIGMHTVTANNGFFDTGAPTIGFIELTATFSAGTFRYYCKMHGSPKGPGTMGMIGFVKVPDSVTAAPSGAPFTVQWASAGTNTGSRFDVEYRVGKGPWQTWKSKTKATKAVFGKNGKPGAARAGTRYSFQSRSRTSKGPSLWSPVASFTP
jgi:plastocyanin